MAEATTNQTKNVSVGKGVKGGYFFAAPIGTARPDALEALGAEFKNLGYISDDGVTESVDEDATDVNDLNGDNVLSEQASHTKTFGLTLIETKAATLREYFGDACVTDADGMITVEEVSGARVSKAYVFDFVLQGGRRERIFIPNGKVTEVGEIARSSGEVVGYEVTITCFPDERGVKTYRWIESTETSAASGVSEVSARSTKAELAAAAAARGIEVEPGATKAQIAAALTGTAEEE